jgi:hypothetical protein
MSRWVQSSRGITTEYKIQIIYLEASRLVQQERALDPHARCTHAGMCMQHNCSHAWR